MKKSVVLLFAFFVMLILCAVVCKTPSAERPALEKEIVAKKALAGAVVQIPNCGGIYDVKYEFEMRFCTGGGKFYAYFRAPGVQAYKLSTTRDLNRDRIVYEGCNDAHWRIVMEPHQANWADGQIIVKRTLNGKSELVADLLTCGTGYGRYVMCRTQISDPHLGWAAPPAYENFLPEAEWAGWCNAKICKDRQCP